MFADFTDSRVTERRYSEFELVELDDGTWKATQQRVDVVGSGDSMPGAVRDYCEALIEDRSSGNGR